MEHENNIIMLESKKKQDTPPDSPEKTYRQPNASENGSPDSSCHFTNSEDGGNLELSDCIFIDLMADEKGRRSAIELIKSKDGRRVVVNAITTSGLDKLKTVAGINVIMRQYHSGQVIRMRALCEAAATEKTPRHFLQESIIPILLELGIIIRAGERSAYWQPWDKLNRKPSLMASLRKSLELTPAQRELKQLADQVYAEQQKLNALKRQEALMQQQKQAYMRLTTQNQQLAELASQHPTKPGLWDKAKANPGASLLVATLVAGILLAANSGHPVDDAPMPTLSAAMQTPAPTPDTAAVAAYETTLIRQQMEAAQ